MNEPNPSGVVDLKNIGDNGKPPKTRLSSAKEAREMVEQFIAAGAERAQWDARYRGMFDGNPPFRRAGQVKNAQAWRSNVNPMEGKAARSAAHVPYYDLFAGSMYYCEAKTYYGTEDQQAEWNQIITEQFDCLLRDYEDFDFNINSLIHDFVGFGKGFLMWPDDVTWQFEHIGQSRVKVRDRAKARLSKLDVLVILEDYGVNELWAYVKNKDVAEKAGWNISGVLQAMREASPENLANVTTDFDTLQQQINDHDLSITYSQPVVRCAHVFVREFSGKITHLIVARDVSRRQQGSATPVVEKFLFEKQGRYEKFSQAICPFFLEALDGSWNGASGLGKDIYASIEIKARLFNQMVDNAFIRASVLAQAKTAAAAQKCSLILGAGVTVIPADYEIVPAHIFADMEGVMLADRSIDEKLSNNTGIYKQKAEKPTGNPRTAKEVELAYSQQAVLGNSAVSRFYKQLDRLFAEVFRRAAAKQRGEGDAQDMARQFQKRCDDAGVPIEALRKIKSVRACRVIGNGSVIMKQQVLDHLIAISGGFPEEGRANLWRDDIAAHANQAAANRYFPVKAITDLPDDHEAYAVMENGLMKVGSPAIVTGTQNHVIHATTHLQATAQAIATLPKGANQEEVFSFLEMEGPHIATHIQKLSQDPTRKNDVKGLAAQWKQLTAFTDKLAKKIEGDREKQAKQQAEAAQAAAKIEAINNGVDPETQILAAETAAELRRKDEKHALSMRQKAQQMQQKGLAAAQQLAIRDAVTAAEIRSKLATKDE